MMIFTADRIGYRSHQALSPDRMATVIGVTSRGLFVRVAPDRVLFVSFERRCGPLTITLRGPIERWRAIDVGATIHIVSGRLICPAIDAAIAVAPEAVWRYPDAARPARSSDEQLDTVRQIAQEVLVRKSDEGFGAWLGPLLGLASESNSGQRTMPSRPSPADLLSLRQALQDGDFTLTLDLINRLLGFGRGLTPSGDDCVMGLLLTLNRWCRAGDWSELNRPVINAAYQRTTTISANMIECAVDGQGDERLLKVVDGIATGEPSVDECVECVLDWGSSSGVDALVGMALAITAI